MLIKFFKCPFSTYPKIGDRFTLRRTFSGEDLKRFSELSGDLNPLHINEEFAKKTIFKDKIIHGVLGVSLFSNLIGNQFSGGIYMSQYVNFVAPIYCEEEIEAIVEVKEINANKNHIILSTRIVKVLLDKLAVTGEAKILYKLKSS